MFKARESSVDTWDLIAGGFYESYSAVPIPCLYLKDGAALTARHFKAEVAASPSLCLGPVLQCDLLPR